MFLLQIIENIFDIQEAGERAVATFSELQKREQEEQADLLNLNDIEE